MRYGIYYAYWSRSWNEGLESYLRHCRSAAALGFDVLEVNAVDIERMGAEELGILRQAASREGLALNAGSGLRKSHDVSAADPATRRAGIAYLENTFRCLEEAGIRKIVGMLHGYWPRDLSTAPLKREIRATSIASVREIADRAAERGITIMLEVANRYECFIINTAAEAVDFVDEVGRDNVRIMLDTFHMNIEEDNIGDAIRHAWPLLGHLHIGDSNRKVPGKGNIDWDEIGAALRDIGYTGDVVFEPFVLSGCEVGRDIKVWRDMSESADAAKLDRDLKASLQLIRSKFSG